ncbi:hypothetical protein, partial [Leucobacter sp. M11]|uniref:hypothetical protein n=1 Tax=Leucobacter sp. M11 TaxID=2993565 RepID=UPI002D7E9CD9
MSAEPGPALSEEGIRARYGREARFGPLFGALAGLALSLVPLAVLGFPGPGTGLWWLPTLGVAALCGLVSGAVASLGAILGAMAQAARDPGWQRREHPSLDRGIGWGAALGAGVSVLACVALRGLFTEPFFSLAAALVLVSAACAAGAARWRARVAERASLGRRASSVPAAVLPPGPMGDRMLTAIVNGDLRRLSWPGPETGARGLSASGAVPRPGELRTLVDSSGHTLAVIRSAGAIVVPAGSVTESEVVGAGSWHESLADWRFERDLAWGSPGALAPDAPMVLERFAL